MHRTVPAFPGRHLVAVDRVHLDVNRQQVVAALGGVWHDLVEEVPHVQSLPLQAPLHIGQGEHDGVDLARLSPVPQLVKLHCESPSVGHPVVTREGIGITP
jgi:hypothetical protein